MTFDLDLDMEQGPICHYLHLPQGQGQRSKFISLPGKIVKTFPVRTKWFHFLLIVCVHRYVLPCPKFSCNYFPLGHKHGMACLDCWWYTFTKKSSNGDGYPLSNGVRWMCWRSCLQHFSQHVRGWRISNIELSWCFYIWYWFELATLHPLDADNAKTSFQHFFLGVYSPWNLSFQVSFK